MDRVRRGELAALTLRSFRLDEDYPSVRLAATDSKNGKGGDIPLHPVVVERLRSWLATKGKVDRTSPLFPLRTASGKSLRKTSKMMQRDLKAARTTWLKEAEDDEAELELRKQSDFLTYCDEDGLFADFHANRHTFISNLGKAGVPLATAQKLARHSDPKLTANVYTHIVVEEQAAAVRGLPAPPQATVYGSHDHQHAQTARETCHDKSNTGNDQRRKPRPQASDSHRAKSSADKAGSAMSRHVPKSPAISGPLTTEPKVRGSNPLGCASFYTVC